MKYIIILIIIFSFGFFNPCFAQTSASQTERTQEITEKEEALRNKLEKEDKFFIKKIIVYGATLLSEDEIKKIVLPFQNHWLSKADMKEIISLIESAYKQKGYIDQPAEISSKTRGNLLKIYIIEKT